MTTPIQVRLRYLPPRARRRAATRPADKLQNLLEYCQARPDPTESPTELSPRTWHDHGLGSTTDTIAQNCAEHRSREVLAWTMIVSPSPILSQLIPPEAIPHALDILTQDILEEYYDERDLPVPWFSFVFHDKINKYGLPQPHTHVFMPGRLPPPNSRPLTHYPADLDLLHTIAHQQIYNRLDIDLGLGWEHYLRPEFDFLPDRVYPAPVIPGDPELWLPELTQAPPPEPRIPPPDSTIDDWIPFAIPLGRKRKDEEGPDLTI
jgi:hypothetical protein